MVPLFAQTGDGGRYHRLSLLANLGLAALKFLVGLVSGSQVLLADSAHSLSDVGLSTAAWIGYCWSRTPPDEDHHYGHGNGEAVAGLVVGLVVIGAGVGLVWAAFATSSRLEPGLLGLAALAVTLVTIVVKLALASVMSRAGRELNSPSIRAVARDHQGDVLAGVLVFVGVGGGLLQIGWVEPAATVLTGLVVVRLGLVSVREGFDTLMDRVPDPALREAIAGTATSVPGVRGVSEVRLHPLGPTFEVAVRIEVDASLTVAAGHAIAGEVEAAICAGHAHVEGVLVHVDPA